MQTFILTDGSNLFYRQINMTNPAAGIDSMIGMSLHLILTSMRKEFSAWNGDHVVFFLEGHSWRKSFYTDYKANRKVTFAQLSQKEQEDHKILQEAFDNLVEYIDTRTNISVLRNPNAEADDMIAIWIDQHPDDKHILVSSDSDFYQLLVYPNLTIYDPIKNIRIQQDGIYNDKNEKLEFKVDSNAKIRVGVPNPTFTPEKGWYEYALFLKCIRGDKTDNIFSAYPGVREKGTKTTVGIREAYGDIHNQGYSWNNFMLQKWEDHNKETQRVKERYEFNKKLIDLREIPQDIKDKCILTMIEEIQRENILPRDIGVHFLKFCGKWDLRRIGQSPESYMPMLTSGYHKS